jgi:hypothetical protein
MSFLQQSDLKKHLSTKSSSKSTHQTDAIPVGVSRVILRDGNLVTLPLLDEQAAETQKFNLSKT